MNYCVQGAQADEFTLAEKELLFDQLIDGATTSPSNFFVRVDKTVLDGNGESEDHRASVAWRNDVEPDSRISHFILRVGTFSPLPDLIAKVTVSGVIGDPQNPLTVVFTGGSIRLRAGTGRGGDNLNLTCPNEDTVTMTLTSQ